MEENTGEGETEGAHRSTVCGEGGGVRKRRHWFRLLSLIDTRAKITGKMLEAVRRGIGFKAGWNP